MGKGIVYCSGCGKALHEQDFDRGLAHEIDDCPYCTACRPLPEPPPPLTSSSTRLKAQKSGSSPRTARAKTPVSVRRVAAAPAGGSSRPLAIGLAAGGVLLIVVAVVLMSGGSSETPEPKPPPAPPPATSDRPAGSSAYDELVRRLAEFAAASTDPDAILLKCDEALQKVRGTPLEARVREIEKRALEKRQQGDWERQINRALASAKELQELDVRREEEALRLLHATREVARHRKPEVEKAIAEFEERRVTRRLETADQIRREDPYFVRSVEVIELYSTAKGLASPKAAAAQSRLAEYEQLVKKGPLAGRQGPHELDDRGGIANWLVIGPFPNPDDKGLEIDYLKGEAKVSPAAGQEIARDGQPAVKWQPHATQDSIVHFFNVVHLGLKNLEQNIVNYGATWILSEEEQDVQVRVATDDGYRLWLDGKEISSVHTHRGVSAEDAETIPVRLTKGLHFMLIKVDQGDGGHEFRVRLTTPAQARAVHIRIYN